MLKAHKSWRLALTVIILSITLLITMATSKHGNSTELKILCAGSLKIPLSKLSEIFSNKYGVKVYIEPSGSVEVIRKVVDLGKPCDVIAIADYRLIPLYLVPNYTDWYIAFATNEIVLAYTESSKYSEELNKNPSLWIDILSRDAVKYGFSDPNKDPCGYRALGVIALASLFYNDSTILERLLTSRVNGISVNITGGSKDDNVHIYVSPSLKTTKNVVIRPKSVDLISLLESGALDYAFEYKSVAIQHNLRFVELPPAINLGNPNYDNFYNRVIIHILAGTEKEKEIIMQSIVYGITIPKNALNRDLAVKFVKLLLSNKGRRIFENSGQPFLDIPIGYGSVPKELRKYVKEG